jgi:hypothetical protein
MIYQVVLNAKVLDFNGLFTVALLLLPVGW